MIDQIGFNFDFIFIFLKKFFKYFLLAVLIFLIATVVYAFPSTSLIDDFNRADGSIGSNYTCNTTFNISSNVLSNPSGSGNYCIYNVTSFGVDQEVYYTVVNRTSTSSHGFLLKKQELTGAINALLVIYRPSSSLYEAFVVEGGTEFSRGTVSGTLGIGDVFGAEVIGNTLIAYKNGSAVASWNVSSFDYIANGGYIAIRTSNNNVLTIDNFSGGSYIPPTSTSTNTLAITNTPTITLTPAPTFTFTPSITPISTATSTATPTSTVTATSTSTPTSTSTITPTITATSQFEITDTDIVYSGDGGFWFKIFSGIFFIMTKMYWEGVLFFVILPYLLSYFGDNSIVYIMILFVIFLLRRFVFDVQKSV